MDTEVGTLESDTTVGDVVGTSMSASMSGDPIGDTTESAETTKTTERKAKPPKKAPSVKVERPAETALKIESQLPKAQARASREAEAVASGYTFEVPLISIISSDNPRLIPNALGRMGYKLVDPKDVEHSLLHMAISDNIEEVQRCVALFEEHEGEPEGYLEDDDANEKAGAKSLITLARHFLEMGQLQPVVVRPVGSSKNKALIFGQRRLSAAIYLHAKSRVDIEEGVQGAKPYPPTIRAVEKKVTAEEAYDMAASENIYRKDFSPLEEAAVYARELGRENPDTKKKQTLKEIAQKFGVHKGRIRSYAAMIKQRNEKTGKGLTDEDRAAIECGDKTVTWGIRRALGEQHYSDGERQETRAKPIPMKAMQQLFDDTAETNEERRRAIAECMGLDLATAVARSEERIAAAEAKHTPKKRRKADQTTEVTVDKEDVGEVETSE